MKPLKAPAAKPEHLRAVAIWIRVSTEDQAKGESPEHHEKRARMYADSKGWRVVRVYDLSAVSGKTVIEHPECKAMFEDVRTGRITGLIFSKLARLARNTKELLEVAEFFQTQGADLVSLEESIDTSTPAGRFFYTMIAGLAQWEREEIAARTRASVKVRAHLGKSTGGAAPFGYRWEKGRLAPDPQEAPIRKLAFELFREHKLLGRVARLLNDAGHRTRSGARFNYTTLRRLIEDPLAKGERRANYTKSLGQKKHWTKKPEEEWVWSEVAPIVSEDLWAECNALLEVRHTPKRNGRPAVQLFTGVVFCSCGAKMYKPSDTPKYVCHSCRNKIPTADLEKVFIEQLRGFFLDAEEVEAALSQGDELLAGKRALFASLEKERLGVRAEMDRVYRAYVEDELTVRFFGERYRPLEERMGQLDEEMPRLQGEIDFLSIQHVSAAQVVSEADTLYGRWETLSFHEKRTIVETIVERIEVGKNEIDFRLALLPPAAMASSPLSEEAVKTHRNHTGSSPPAGEIAPDR